MRHRTLLLLGIVVTAFGLRLGALLWTAPTDPVADEVEYLWRSSALVEGRDVPDPAKRPPASIWWYALFQWIGAPGATSARFANVLAGTAGVLLLGLLGARLYGSRVGLVAAGVAALYPNLVMYSSSLWSESLYVALTLAGLLLVTSERPGFPGLAGAVFGLAALTREVGLVLILLGPVLLARGRGSRAAALFVAAFVATVTPWTIRINRGEDPFALITRTPYLNLFLGNAPLLEGQTGHAPAERRPGVVFRRQREYTSFGRTPAERETKAKEIALRAIRDRLPAWPLEKTAEMIPALVTPNSLPAARLLARPGDQGWARQWSYRLAGGESARDAIAWLAIAGWCLIALAGVAGWSFAGGGGGAGLLAAFAALHVLPVIVTFGCSRFRIPVVPVLILGAAVLLVRGARSWREADGKRRGLAVVATATMAVLIASMWSSVVTPQWG